MPHNLLITYELEEKPGETRDHQSIEDLINLLGAAVRIRHLQFYVCAEEDGSMAVDYMVSRGKLRYEDRLLVIDISSNTPYRWGFDEDKWQFIRSHWAPRAPR